MAFPDTDNDVSGVIAAAVGSLVLGENMFLGARRGYADGVIPHKAVFVLADGGQQSRNLHGYADERHPRVEVRVRSDPPGVAGAFQAGQSLARAVFEAVHLNPPAGYCDSVTTDSAPSYEGVDEDGHHEWIVYVDLIVDA